MRILRYDPEHQRSKTGKLYFKSDPDDLEVMPSVKERPDIYPLGGFFVLNRHKEQAPTKEISVNKILDILDAICLENSIDINDLIDNDLERALKAFYGNNSQDIKDEKQDETATTAVEKTTLNNQEQDLSISDEPIVDIPENDKIDVSELNSIMESESITQDEILAELTSKTNSEDDIKFDAVESFTPNDKESAFSNVFNREPKIIIHDKETAERAGIEYNKQDNGKKSVTLASLLNEENKTTGE